MSGNGRRIASRLHSAPARGQVPEQQGQTDVEARLAGDRPLDVEVVGATLGAAQKRLDQLRPRTHPLGEGAVEHRKTHRHQCPPRDRARQQLLHGAGRRLDQVARAEQLGGDAVADPDVDGQHALEDEQPRTG